MLDRPDEITRDLTRFGDVLDRPDESFGSSSYAWSSPPGCDDDAATHRAQNAGGFVRGGAPTLARVSTMPVQTVSSNRSAGTKRRLSDTATIVVR